MADLEGHLLQTHSHSLAKATGRVPVWGGSPSTPIAPGAAPKSPPAPLQGASEHKSGFLLNCMADLEGALLQTHYHSLGKATGRVLVWGGSPSTPTAPGAAPKPPPAPLQGGYEHKSGFLFTCMADLEGALLQTHSHTLVKAIGRVPVWGGGPSIPTAPGAAQKPPPAPQRGAA